MPGEEKDKCHYLQGTAVQVSRDIIEIESTYCSVNKRDAIKQQSAGEKCGEDVLGTGFGGCGGGTCQKATNAAIGILAVSSPMKNIRKCPAEIIKYMPSSVERVSM